MGSGKSTLGRSLANKLGYAFVDLDKAVEQRAAQTIAELFTTHGESYFRRLETETLHTLSTHDNTVVSTGGGTPCFDDNMQYMLSNGITIYLKHDPKTLYNRLIHAKIERPLVRDKSPAELMEYIEQTMNDREQFYGQAQVIIGNASRDVSQIVNILSYYQNNN